MKIHPAQAALTLVNLAILVLTFSVVRPAAAAQETAPVLRGSALQIVDSRGRVRASISVSPASKKQNGEMYPETVLLRLITEEGRPSVKLSASEPLSGLALVGTSGTKQTYVQIGARGAASSLTLKNEDGRERVITP